MSVYKRKNSKYYYCEITVSGKTIIRSTKTTKKNLALRFESQLREKIYRNKVLGERPLVSISEIIDLYAKSKKGAVTPRNLNSQVRVLSDQLSRVYPLKSNLDGLSNDHLTSLVQLRRREGISAGSIRLMISTLRGVIKHAERAGYIQPNSLFIPSITVKNQRTRVLSHEEENKLLEYLYNNNQVDSYDLTVLLLDTGARLNEIQQANWEQIDFNNRQIVIWRDKNKTQSLIKLTKRCLVCLQRRYKSKVNNELIFPSKKGTKRRTAPYGLQKAYKVLGLDGVSTHTLRHTTASKLVRSGMSLYSVSKILGHSSVQITERYAHLCESQVAQEALSILEK